MRVNTLLAAAVALLFVAASQAAIVRRTILTVAPVCVQAPVGTVPRLPYQVWVTYSDGKSEYRQVRWSNSSFTTEQAQADEKAYPAGTRYSIHGHILGDNTTDNGYPIKAEIIVVEGGYPAPASKALAHPIPLNDITLDGDNRLTSNRNLALREIVRWDVDQQLYNYRDTYGLSTEGYPRSDGWDSPDTKLKGHGSGHYMSALALAYAVSADSAQRATLSVNITRMVDELRRCQERTFVWNDSLGRYWEARDFASEAELREMKGTWEAFDRYKTRYGEYGYGYLNAIPAQHCALVEMYRAYNNSDWVWAPYYAIHKQLAGLIDIATYYDDKAVTDKALLVAKDMGLWVWNRLHYRTYVKADGTKAERRATPGNRYEMWDMYIAGEVGGMSESLSRLSEMVSDSTEKARLIEAASYFDAPKFYEPLSRNIDDIRTRHANQHIPMIVGALRSYLTNGNPYYYHIAENFWSLVQGRYRYATGGVGNGEMFRQPYTQILNMAGGNPHINETCCAYNLLKLTKDLNAYNPDDARYMDYYERTLYNQIVGSLHPTEYHTTYQYAVGLNASKPWGNETPQMSCCGGTGSENHVKYQEAAYFASDDCLWVGLYLPTTLRWRAKGVTLQQTCLWPAERSTLRVTRGTAPFALKFRVPYWATQGFDVKLNGRSIASEYKPCSYVTIPTRTWKPGDEVQVTMPFGPHIDFGPDKLSAEQAGEGLAAAWVGVLMYGPLAMTATDVGTWKEATLHPDSLLSAIVVAPHTLRAGGKEFLPDYRRHDHTTHYFRLLDTTSPAGTSSPSADVSELKQLLRMAQERKQAQEAWEALPVKVPEHAPWAPHGYERLMQAMKAAEVLHVDVEAAIARLNTALNTMRPGHLAEVEDLRPLSDLVNRLASDPAKKEAVAYARMVIRYVQDGSGTPDMIQSALTRLREP